MQQLLQLDALRFVAIFLGIPGVLLLLGTIQWQWRALRRWSSGLLISYVTTVLLLGGCELYLRYEYATTGGNYDWGNRNWKARYWKLNTMGYRDPEWTTMSGYGKTRVLAVGDSFTEGMGVNDPHDRFADVLGTRLGDKYHVVNVGMLGAATTNELHTLQQVGVKKGDIVLFQYYLNDIEPAADSVFGAWQWPERNYPPLAAQSALVGYLYLRLRFNAANTSLVDAKSGLPYAAWTYRAYNDASVWALHAAELNAVIDYVQGAGARLIVVIFPHLTEVKRGASAMEKVAGVFRARGVQDILKVDDVGDWPVPSLVSSPYDAHPSVALHRHVGLALYERFFTP